MALLGSLLGQFATLPYPNEDCTGRTIIVTGANSGLGLEAARHFVRLNAAKVILACRSVDKAEAAQHDIEGSTKRLGVIDVWQLDLASFDSVKEFAARAARLERLDVLLNNASVLAFDWALSEGHETMVTVNVISTLLLTVLLLPTLRRTGTRFNLTPHAVIVSSGGAFLTYFPERRADEMLNRLKVNRNYYERYNTTKLMQLMAMRKLAQAADASGKGRVVVNSLDPGFCRTQLFRRIPFPFNWAMGPAFAVFGRSAEVGSRTLMAAAFSNDETHGRWMANCKLHVWPSLMAGDEGERVMDKLWGELTGVLEGIEPGVMGNV
ncbi:short chain dehydrogenase [Hirsutella rhossiliensis]|uniref:Short chain dehydrogenase domain-containing protein n=1 Tax=Hirsutella rhossiliensis TaxID=111463 RepID=A0A9P8N314_9HYPO|nr:short chain dehydrogenase domain-containing protein [Hirsutella rhossiliensis]KAH0964934.1 short chain dehydrogenase domain-containing protein [Hirsutella rhossiliensis]